MLDDRLLGAFDGYWRECVGDRPTNPLQPFWYLQNDGGLWQLAPRTGAPQMRHRNNAQGSALRR